MAAVALIGAGYADFALIAYHFGRAAVVPAPLIPILYAVAMASDAVAALLLGHLFDRRGIMVVLASTVVAAAASPLVFLGGAEAAFAGMLLWGVGAQESIIRAVVARMTAPTARARPTASSTPCLGWPGSQAASCSALFMTNPSLLSRCCRWCCSSSHSRSSSPS
jgi:hypothetical protein